MKTYHSDIRNEYYRDAFICVDLLELQLYNSSGVAIPRYFTTAGMNIMANSSLTGSQVTYTAQGDFLGFTSMSENLETSVGKFSIQLCGMNLDLINDISVNDAEGKKVIVKKAFLNAETLQLIQAPITVYEGYIFNFAVTETNSTINLNVSCASLFSDFERSAGRKTNNWSNWLLQGVNYDKCMDKAGYVGQSEFLWGRLAK
jgi:hypothetical protein